MASRCQLPNIRCHLFFAEHQVSATAFSKVWVTIITTCVTTQFTYYVRAEQLQKPVCVCAHRDGSHEENVHVTTVCGAAVTASDIHLKLFSVKERVERRGKQLS